MKTIILPHSSAGLINDQDMGRQRLNYSSTNLLLFVPGTCRLEPVLEFTTLDGKFLNLEIDCIRFWALGRHEILHRFIMQVFRVRLCNYEKLTSQFTNLFTQCGSASCKRLVRITSQASISFVGFNERQVNVRLMIDYLRFWQTETKLIIGLNFPDLRVDLGKYGSQWKYGSYAYSGTTVIIYPEAGGGSGEQPTVSADLSLMAVVESGSSEYTEGFP